MLAKLMISGNSRLCSGGPHIWGGGGKFDASFGVLLVVFLGGIWDSDRGGGLNPLRS